MVNNGKKISYIAIALASVVLLLLVLGNTLDLVALTKSFPFAESFIRSIFPTQNRIVATSNVEGYFLKIVQPSALNEVIDGLGFFGVNAIGVKSSAGDAGSFMTAKKLQIVLSNTQLDNANDTRLDEGGNQRGQYRTSGDPESGVVGVEIWLPPLVLEGSSADLEFNRFVLHAIYSLTSSRRPNESVSTLRETVGLRAGVLEKAGMFPFIEVKKQ